MPPNHLNFCHPLLLLPSVFPSIRVLSNEPALPIRWPKYWSFSFNTSPSNGYPGLISFRLTGWISVLSKGLSTTDSAQSPSLLTPCPESHDVLQLLPRPEASAHAEDSPSLSKPPREAG